MTLARTAHCLCLAAAGLVRAADAPYEANPFVIPLAEGGSFSGLWLEAGTEAHLEYTLRAIEGVDQRLQELSPVVPGDSAEE